MAVKVQSLPSRNPKQNLAQGAKVQGPPHEQGGVEVQDQGGQPVAEVEGGERIFSTEDTAQIEQACQQIAQLQEQNPKAADKLAQELGYAVCEMVIRQEQNAQAEAQGVGAEQQEDPANSFGTPPAPAEGGY